MKITKDVQLHMDDYNGEGMLTTSDKWDNLDPVFRADVARDWMYEILELYSDARKDCGWSGITIEIVTAE